MKFSTLIEATIYFSNEQNCTDYLTKLRWKQGITCVFCNCSTTYHLKKYNRYKCADCKKQFSITKGTIFENSPISLSKWFVAMYLIGSQKRGISSYQLADHIGVTQATAWFMAHRIRFALKAKSIQAKITDPIEVDETFVGGKNKNRHPDKKVKNSQGRSFKDKTPVLGVMELNGRFHTIVIPDTKAKTIQPILKRMVEKGTIVATDEWKAYNGIDGYFNHKVVDHHRGQYVNEEGFTTNACECAWSHLKRMIIGTYYKVSRKHLQRYCDEFTFRYNSRTLNSASIFTSVFNQIESRLTYKQLVA